MRAGYNPARRNRNIGTAKQGHGQDNRLVIPEIATASRSWGQTLGPHQQMQRVVAGREVIFIVEDTHGRYRHACTVDDIRHVLAHIPPDDWEGLDTFVLRQSTRKQRLLRPVWGSMYYGADLGLPNRRTIRQGPAVMLEAQDFDARIEWSTSLQPDEMERLERLRADGHSIERQGGRFCISMTPQAVRATQLYHTLLHEIGHWLDYLEKVERPTDGGEGEFDALHDAYFQRPKSERESFAHRYADTTRERLQELGVIPFDPISGVRPLSRPR